MMNTAEANIGSFLRELRMERGFSQAHIAAALNVPLRTYQSWEKAFTSSAANLFALAGFYSITADQFFQAVERAIKSLPIPAAVLKQSSIHVAYAAAGGAGTDEIASLFPDYFTGDNYADQINTAILDAYFSSSWNTPLVEAPRDLELETALSSELGIKSDDIQVISCDKLKFQSLKEMALAGYGARLIQSWSAGKPLFRLGISNGYTIARILDQLPRREAENLVLFPLNFTKTPADYPISTSSLISSFQYRHEGRCAEYRHMNESEVYGAMMLADAAILGIGSFMQEGLYSRMIRATLGRAYLERVIEAGAVGDFNYYLLDKNGGKIDFPELVSAIGPQESPALIKSIELELLAKKADRNCPVAIVAAGEHKADLVRLVVGKGYVNKLLIDSSLTRKLLQSPRLPQI